MTVFVNLGVVGPAFSLTLGNENEKTERKSAPVAGNIGDVGILKFLRAVFSLKYKVNYTADCIYGKTPCKLHKIEKEFFEALCCNGFVNGLSDFCSYHINHSPFVLII